MNNTSYTETANMNLRIPTRSEFHRYTSEKLEGWRFFYKWLSRMAARRSKK